MSILWLYSTRWSPTETWHKWSPTETWHSWSSARHWSNTLSMRCDGSMRWFVWIHRSHSILSALLLWGWSMEGIASTLNSWLVCRWGWSVKNWRALRTLSQPALMSALGPVRRQNITYQFMTWSSSSPHTSRCLDMRLRFHWRHQVQQFIGGGHFKLRTMRQLGGGALLCLNVLNILKLSDLALIPFDWPTSANWPPPCTGPIQICTVPQTL